MTEKRFNRVGYSGIIQDKQGLDIIPCSDYGMDRLCEFLNEQHEEIERLKKEKQQLIIALQESAKIMGSTMTTKKDFTVNTNLYKK